MDRDGHRCTRIGMELLTNDTIDDECTMMIDYAGFGLGCTITLLVLFRISFQIASVTKSYSHYHQEPSTTAPSAPSEEDCMDKSTDDKSIWH